MVLAAEIDALLPQTQCEECGYPGCLPYAQALAKGCATIDLCPPGGTTTMLALANLLGVDPKDYIEKSASNTRAPCEAIIRESECIGCTKCIQVCPVDAIVGSAKHMHSIISHECTGCGLCVAPCPVDCIDISPLDAPKYDKDLARQKFNERKIRLLKEAQEKEKTYREKRLIAAQSEGRQQDKKAKQDYIQQALLRVRKKHE